VWLRQHFLHKRSSRLGHYRKVVTTALETYLTVLRWRELGVTTLAHYVSQIARRFSRHVRKCLFAVVRKISVNLKQHLNVTKYSHK